MTDETRMTSDQAHVDALHVKAQAKGTIEQDPAFQGLDKTDPVIKPISQRLESRLYQLSSDTVDEMKQTMPKTYEQYRVRLAAVAELETALGEDRLKELAQQTTAEINSQPEAHYSLSLEGRTGEGIAKIRQDPKWQDVPERLWGRLFETIVNETRVNQAVANRPDVTVINPIA